MFERNKNKQPEAKKAAEVAPATQPRAQAVSQSAVTVRNVAMIGPSIKIKGEVTGDEDLVVQGRVEGTIDLGDREVSVGESGQVFAEVKAKVIRIDGEVTGNITATDIVMISKLGNVRGNIVAPRVTLEDGARFKGSIDMDPVEVTATKPVAVGSQKMANNSLHSTKTAELDLKSGKA
jgi:cytoskeletal protein CcmA (bactofilin family)